MLLGLGLGLIYGFVSKGEELFFGGKHMIEARITFWWFRWHGDCATANNTDMRGSRCSRGQWCRFVQILCTVRRAWCSVVLAHAPVCIYLHCVAKCIFFVYSLAIICMTYLTIVKKCHTQWLRTGLSQGFWLESKLFSKLKQFWLRLT